MKTKRSFNPGLAGVLALSLSCSALAGEEEKPRIAIGEATQAYLQMQRDGTAAGREQPISGEVASRSYQRYLKSFDEPISPAKGNATSAPRPTTSGNSSR